MVQNIIKISERENRIVNIVKAKYGLKNKNQALGLIIQTYEQNFLPDVLRPLEKTCRNSKIPVKDINELREVIKE